MEINEVVIMTSRNHTSDVWLANVQHSISCAIDKYISEQTGLILRHYKVQTKQQNPQ